MTSATDKQKGIFPIRGMTCAACAARIEKNIRDIPGIIEAFVNLASEEMTVSWDAKLVSSDAIVKRVEELGFQAQPPAVESPSDEVKADFDIRGMSCAVCSGRLEKVISALPGVIGAFVNLASESAHVVFNPGLTGTRKIREAIAQAGFEASLPLPDAAVSFGEKRRQAMEQLEGVKKKLYISFAFAVPLFVLSMAGMFETHDFLPSPGGSPRLYALLSLVLTVPVMLTGRHFFVNGLGNLRRLSPNMDSLIALGTGAAFVYSLWSTLEAFIGGDPHKYAHDLYYESAAVIIALVSLGKYLEARSRLKTADALEKLVSLKPETATLIGDGGAETIAASEIEAGDLLLVKPGERIPADALVVEGFSGVDESMLTGESLPVAKKAGDKVIGGSLNKNGSLKIKAVRVGADSVLAGIIRLVRDAQGSKAPIAALADKISLYFVPAVLLIAICAFLAWYLSGAGFSFALRVFIAVMVIACPCAMGLAVPTAIMVGTGRGAKLGILVKSGAALEIAGQVAYVAFDKTGTLTFGRPELTDVLIVHGRNLSVDEILELAGAAEAKSEHPLAGAVVRAAEEHLKKSGKSLPEADSFENLPGLGIRATVNGQEVVIGNRMLMTARKIIEPDHPEVMNDLYVLAGHGKTPVLAAVDGKLAAILAISDKIRPETPEVIRRLKSMGITPVMITGDNPQTARVIAEQAGIETFEAQVLPDGKAAIIERLRQQGTTAMVGDGINDAPALAAADLGIAVGSGIDVAMDTGDIVLMREGISGILSAISLSRAVMNTIKANLFWAFIYNIVGIPIAAGVLYALGGPSLNPMIAGAAMAMSSISVVGNSLRLRFFSPRI